LALPNLIITKNPREKDKNKKPPDNNYKIFALKGNVDILICFLNEKFKKTPTQVI
jgi:hypothetical protein